MEDHFKNCSVVSHTILVQLISQIDAETDLALSHLSITLEPTQSFETKVVLETLLFGAFASRWI